MTGYRKTAAGSLCHLLFLTYTPVFVAIYCLLIIDTYWSCELAGPDALCFFGANPLLGTTAVNEHVFFGTWCMGVSWALFNYVAGAHVPNFFRSMCEFKDATHVLCQCRTRTIVMSAPSRLVRLSRRLSRACAAGGGASYYSATAQVNDQRSARTIEFMCCQYVLSPGTEAFERATLEVDREYGGLVLHPGLATGEQRKRLALLGPNTIPYRLSTWAELVASELCSYLYLYQLTFFLVWLWFGGLLWCSPQVVVVAVCACSSICIQRSNQVKIQRISHAGKGTLVAASRDGNWGNVPSEDLVPGDRVKLDSSRGGGDWVVPCDMVVTKGTCVCDESGLTGESMPVRKSEVPRTPGAYDAQADAKHTLYAGTTLLQADTEGSEAVVTQTGIRTAKGELISAILFPSSMVFEYDEELRVVFGLLSIYATLLFFISVWLQTKISPLSWVAVFAFACFTISQILPPLLPVALVIGHTKSASRLKHKNVMCVQPKRIAISGKIHAFMFDKTGTLTKQGLDFVGVHRTQQDRFTPAVPHQGSANLQELLAYQPAKAAAKDKMAWSMATCHALTALRAQGSELVGNQVEVKMFQGCGWQLQEEARTATVSCAGTKETLAIEKRFEFDHHTMTMVRTPTLPPPPTPK